MAGAPVSGRLIPDCSVCGLAVDWIRSCYQSRWHLFGDAPGTSTPGRYYVCPPKTPFVSVPNLYLSRTWLDNNFINVQGLGEDLTTKHTWDNGTPPAVLPNNEIIGSDDCIRDGDSIVNGLDFTKIRNGFSISCYAPAVPRDPIWEAASTYQSCSLQYFYAKAIEWVYEHDIAKLTTAFRMLLGPATTVQFFLGTSALPDMCVAKTNTCSVIVIDGTTTFQQGALQAFMGIDLPFNFGAFGTQPLWYTASTHASNNLVAAGIDVTKPIMIAGHSYGGACASVLMARILGSGRTQPFRMITYGNPKPGDERLRQILESADAIHLANDDDVVTALGPDLLELGRFK